jgi:hypothetical protein
VVVELKPKRKSVKEFWFGVFAPCAPDGAFAPTYGVQDFPIHNGRFGDDFSDEAPDGSGGVVHLDVSLHGRVSRTSASGTVSITATDRDAAGNTLVTCASGPQGWTARQ